MKDQNRVLPRQPSGSTLPDFMSFSCLAPLILLPLHLQIMAASSVGEKPRMLSSSIFRKILDSIQEATSCF